MIKQRPQFILIAAITGALALSACGKNEDHTTTATPPPPAATPAPPPVAPPPAPAPAPVAIVWFDSLTVWPSWYVHFALRTAFAEVPVVETAA